MKAEFKSSKHGLCLEITAMTDMDKQQLAEFMRARVTAHKPRLKLLKVQDKTAQLRFAHVRLINYEYRNATFSASGTIETKNLDGSAVQLIFSRELRKRGAVTWYCASNFANSSGGSYPITFYIAKEVLIDGVNTRYEIIEEFTCSSVGELESRMAKY